MIHPEGLHILLILFKINILRLCIFAFSFNLTNSYVQTEWKKCYFCLLKIINYYMKNTVFYDIHVSLGAKIIPFAGFNMPVEFSGINDEHITVREKVGIFDVSHMGEIWVKGESAKDFVQKVTSNDINRLSPGKVQYTCFPNGNGGIIDDLLVYEYSEAKYLLIVNASNIDKDWNWLVKNNSEKSVLENASGKISQLAVQGPFSTVTMQKLTRVDLSVMKSFTFVTDVFAGVNDVIISKTGYTGSDGFELYFYNEHGPLIWNKIMDAGKEFGIKPVGLAARDTLRLEAGLCLYGNDIDDNTSPLEAGLGWITKFTEGNNFIDREFLELQKKEGLKRKLTGFRLTDRGIPRQHYEIFDLQRVRIGEVTSGTMSPLSKTGIGMGYVEISHSEPGTEILIKIRNNFVKAEVIQLPFYKKPNK